MAIDHFERYPIRTSKGGGTKCTTCEVTTDCHPAAKCIYPWLCVSFNMASCGYDIALVNAVTAFEAIQYNCDIQAFDLSFLCGGYEIDLLLSYEEIDGEPSAVLRSYFLAIEQVIPFTDAINARCPHWDFDLGNGETVSVRKYEMVSIGQQKCVNSGPDDCTAGRCLPRYLCADVYTVDRPDEPYSTQLEWYVNNTVTLQDNAHCNANVMPERLVARVINFSDGCTCIAPKRFSTVYFSAEQAAAVIEDPGAILHLKHGVAVSGDAFVSGYPNVPIGAHYWLSESFLADSLAPLCPAPEQTRNPYTLDTYGRLILWSDPADGTWQACFEIVDYSGSVAASNTDYLTPFNQSNPFSNVYRIVDGKVLCCSPFQISLEGIVENNFCQDLSSTNGTGVLKIHVGEFQGWTGPNPLDYTKQITLYSERINTASPPQTLPTDCLPKLHIQSDASLLTFKGRTDAYSVSSIWPDHVFTQSEYVIVGQPPIQSIVIHPRPCSGCDTLPPVDPYGPVNTGCCPNSLPRVLYATAVVDNDCACAEGVVVSLVYDDVEQAWLGTAPFGTGGYCSCTVTMRLACEDLISSNIWKLTWGLGSFSTDWTPSTGLGDRSFACDPFYWETRSVSSSGCCASLMSQFHWIISE